MFKVNLEKELIRQNKSIVSAKELLLIGEYDKIGDDNLDNTLSRVFTNNAAIEGRVLKNTKNANHKGTEKFNQERVFHISQIKSLCEKYRLRFLPTPYYKGSIDKETASKISQFEIAYDQKCGGWIPAKYSRDLYLNGNTFIVAPSSSFELQEKPKDPLLFFMINDEFYYLIHKWGNDLSVFRRILRLFSTRMYSLLIMFLLATPIIAFLFSKEPFEENNISVFGISAIILLVSTLVCSIYMIVDNGGFIKKNEWQSQYK